jgi:tRNA (cmo5U34)-methyltransferase
MSINYAGKATNEEIRNRFDNDVERFSNLDTGQATTIDAPLTMELCTEAAKYINPNAKNLLDIGCGAGNYTLKMLSKISNLNCTLNDLSLPMLERAKTTGIGANNRRGYDYTGRYAQS